MDLVSGHDHGVVGAFVHALLLAIIHGSLHIRCYCECTLGICPMITFVDSLIDIDTCVEIPNDVHHILYLTQEVLHGGEMVTSLQLFNDWIIGIRSSEDESCFPFRDEAMRVCPLIRHNGRMRSNRLRDLFTYVCCHHGQL
jgi:hypothetical protein